jgi:hypothetical protein
MDSRTAAALIIVAALVVWGGWYVTRAFLVWRRLRGDRIVTCPETGRPAAVHIDTALAVTSDAGSDGAGLDSCSRWSERGACDQPCARAAQAPESATSAVVKAWAQDQRCASCGGELVESRLGHHIALLEPDGTTREWVDVAADRLPLALVTSLPVCWNCHVAATFRRMYPQLITDREEEAVHVRRAEP